MTVQEQFEEGTLDDIETDVAVTTSVDDLLGSENDRSQHTIRLLEHRANLLEQEVRDRAQTHTMRSSFATVIKWTMIGTLAATCLLMAAYLYASIFRQVSIDSTVMVAWFSSTVVQVIGLVYIVANYLFPGEKKKAE